MADNTDDRWKRLNFRPPPPSDVAEPDQPVLVEYVSGGRVALITLNRPHADNAITTELAASLIEILETIAARASVRVAILTGAGDRAFSVGGDLRQRKNMTKEDWLRQRQVFDRVLYTLRQLRRPIIAAVHGMAYGGGCEIAISTDFIIASDDALFGQPEAMVGLSAGGGSPVFLPRVLPPGKAMQMLMTGEPITAQEAYRLGMVNEVHPRAELMRAVLRIAEKIAGNSPTAVQAVKRAVRHGRGRADRAGGRDHDGGALALGRPSRPRRGHPRLQRGPRAGLPGSRLLSRRRAHDREDGNPSEAELPLRLRAGGPVRHRARGGGGPDEREDGRDRALGASGCRGARHSRRAQDEGMKDQETASIADRLVTRKQERN